MKAVLELFWRMCLLRQSPEYVPTQSWFVASVIGANLVCSLLVTKSLDAETDVLTSLNRIVVGQAVNAGLVWMALSFRNHASRFAATLTALFGCDLIITACFGVLVPLLSLLGESALSFLSLAFLLWSVAVAGYILSRALSVRLGIGVVVAMGVMVLSVATSQLATQAVP